MLAVNSDNPLDTTEEISASNLGTLVMTHNCASFRSGNEANPESSSTRLCNIATVVRSRVPIFLPMTVLITSVSSYLAFDQGVNLWGAAFLLLSLVFVEWQIQLVRNLPILVFHKAAVTLSRKGIPCDYSTAEHLSVLRSNSSIGLLVLCLFGASAALLALGTEPALRIVPPTVLRSSSQRLITTMAGIWVAATAGSLIQLDLPRRKILLKRTSLPAITIYVADRRQRRKLLIYLRAVHLREVRARVGLEPVEDVKELRQRGPFTELHHGTGR